MGIEHQLLDRLADAAAGKKPSRRLPMPKDGFGPSRTMNQKCATCGVWLVEACLWSPPSVEQALDRAIEFYGETMKFHWSLGSIIPGVGLPGTEVLTPSHSQIWYAGMAAAVWGAIEADSGGDLYDLAAARWRVETGTVRHCIYGGKLTVLTPGARAGTKATPKIANSARDKVIGGLLAGWKRAPRVSAKDPSYEVAVPLLSQAFRAGAAPADLLGERPALDAPFGFHVKRNGDDFYAWFEQLPATQPLWGAGRIDGETVLEWEREGAAARGEAFAGQEIMREGA